MKKYYLKTILFLSFITILIGCKKTLLLVPETSILTSVKSYLKSQVNEEIYQKIDWTKYYEFKRNGKIEIITIPFVKSEKINNRLIYLTVIGNDFDGNYFERTGDYKYSEVITTSFDEKTVYKLKIKDNQFIGNHKIDEEFNNRKNHESLSNRAYHYIPATIVHNYQLYVNIMLLGIGQPNWNVGNPNNNTQLEYIEPLGEEIGNPNNGVLEDIIEFELEDVASKPGIDIVKMFNCFDLVPSGMNAHFTIKLNSDIPSNGNEGIPFLLNGNPGHSFLTVTKTNGSQSVTQSFGFYPTTGYQSIGLSNVSSKIVNDEGHEINASLSMDINEASFNLMKANAIYWSTQQYNLQSNNCADFAINLFNLSRSNSLIQVDLFNANTNTIIGSSSIPIIITQSPHML